jgi:hypothetical protein
MVTCAQSGKRGDNREIQPRTVAWVSDIGAGKAILRAASGGKANKLDGVRKGTRMTPLPLSPSTFIVLMVVEALFAIPAGLVLRRTGHSMWWSLLCFVPIAALFGLWVLALTRWTPPRPVSE